jgi:ankyrin repeat protein
MPFFAALAASASSAAGASSPRVARARSLENLDDFKDLLALSRLGDFDAVIAAVDFDPVVLGKSNDEGLRLLHKAGCGGHVSLARELIKRGANIHAKDKFGEDALMFASQKGHVAVVKLLLEFGADPNTSNLSCWTALGWAASFDCLEVCVLLLEAGADLRGAIGIKPGETELYGRFPYHLSCEVKAERRKLLLKAFINGPHPSQIQRRKNENWARKSIFMIIVAENGFRPLAARRLEQELARVSLDPANEAEVPAVVLDTPEKRHAHYMGQVFSNDGLLRLVVSFL